MRTYTLTHRNDAALLRDLDAVMSQERGAMATVIAHLAEVDRRRLYLPAGYPSMYEYCIRKLGLSEQAALKRVRAARTARRFPVIFGALAAGQLHLTAVVLLAPHLTADNADDLLDVAAHRSKAEIEELLARWFPKPDVPARLEPIAPATPAPGSLSSGPATLVDAQVSSGTLSPRGNTDFMGSAHAPRLAPLAPERFLVQFTIPKDIHETLRYVQALLSHQVPSPDLVSVFARALDALKEQLEKQKFAATSKPRPHVRTHRSSGNPRYIPAGVRRAVWMRDEGRCTFLNATGDRCPARSMLEFDHIVPVARGGRATVDGMRLLCRAHNQYEAERSFGAGFMNEKRVKSRRAGGPSAARDTRAVQSGAPITAVQAPIAAMQVPVTEVHGGVPITALQADIASTPTRSIAPVQEQVRDVMAGLRALGFRTSEARRAVSFCETVLESTLEERMRAALRFLCPPPGQAG